ncbi:hypothetical protein SDC9_210144 [bioreactor metagenome]|uniref:Uncharacterized protein n=1 Tax=bioreactor metagenome TaxID=1076179 RepID=A0A645JGB1_9ZZZZ
MHEHLNVLPHPGLFAPAVAQPDEFVRGVLGYHVFDAQAAEQTVEIVAGVVEIDVVAVGRAVVERGQEIGKRGQLAEQQSVVSAGDRTFDH